MNRQMKRAKAKAKHDSERRLTVQEMQRLLDAQERDFNARIEAAKVNMVRELAIMAVVVAGFSARDVYGFGAVRVERLIIDMIRKFEDYTAGWYTAEDALAQFKTETGMDIVIPDGFCG